MSFLKITDPAKRDLIVADFLETKRRIQQNFLSEKLGDIGMQQELTKLYKPIVDSQSAISKEQNALLSTLNENTAATSNALQALPASISTSLKAIQYPQYPSLNASGDPVESVRTLEYGQIAGKYWNLRESDDKLADKTFGIRSGKDGIYRIGNAPITIQGNDIEVAGKTYKGTPGLWGLITLKDPGEHNDNDLSDYTEILWSTKAMETKNNPNKPISSRGYKYNKIIKPIWEAKKGKAKVGEEQVGEATIGEGVVVIPQDPNALVEMLSLRIASFQAGNTGVRNEIVEICEELKRQGVIDTDSYKNLML